VYHAYYYSLSRGLALVSFHIWNMYCFIHSIIDDDPEAAYGPIRGSAPDHLWGARSRLAGWDVERNCEFLRDMIDIIFMLYPLKCRTWLLMLLRLLDLFNSGSVSYFMTSLFTVHWSIRLSMLWWFSFTLAIFIVIMDVRLLSFFF